MAQVAHIPGGDVVERLHALCRAHGRTGPWRCPEGPNEVLLVDLAHGYWTVRHRAQVAAIGAPPGFRPADRVAEAEWAAAIAAAPAP